MMRDPRRYFRVFVRMAHGATAAEVGASEGVTASRALQMFYRMERVARMQLGGKAGHPLTLAQIRADPHSYIGVAGYWLLALERRKEGGEVSTSVDEPPETLDLM